MIETGNPVNFKAIVFSAAAGVALAAVGVTDAGASLAAASPGTQLWMKIYANRGNGGALSEVVSPNGSTVFVTGYTTTARGAEDDTTVAYNSVTGAQRWAKSYGGPGGMDRAVAVAVSPNGKAVFVTGYSFRAVSGVDYATVAYNAATGAQRWAKRYDGPGSGDGQAYSAAVSPNGATVFVTGYTDTSSTSAGYDYATVAYNAATGALRWAARYNGTANFTDEAFSVAVAPGGGTVYVTGESAGGSFDGWGWATVAYNAATGSRLWIRRYDGAGGARAFSVAVSRTTGTVFVTGYSGESGDYATIAYKG
jgi:hypothetical protein